MRWVLIVAGVVLMGVGFFYDPSIPSGGSEFGSVINIGLVAQKQLIFSLGAVLFLSGVIAACAHRIIAVIRDPTVPPKRPTVDEILAEARARDALGSTDT